MGIRVDELSSTERQRLVCFADEHGMTVGLCEERDGAQRHAVLVPELPRRVDEAHGGFTAINNGNALEFVLHERLRELSCFYRGVR
jgi:hypothetical protein